MELAWTQVLEACGTFVPGVLPAVPPGVPPRAITCLMQKQPPRLPGRFALPSVSVGGFGSGLLHSRLSDSLPTPQSSICIGALGGRCLLLDQSQAHTPTSQSSMPLGLLLRQQSNGEPSPSMGEEMCRCPPRLPHFLGPASGTGWERGRADYATDSRSDGVHVRGFEPRSLR